MEFLAYPTTSRRSLTRQVEIGNLKIGGHHPILIQSMLVCPVTNLDRAFNEITALARVGCPLIRVTTPSLKEIEATARLKTRMAEEGLNIPLVADIHFNAALAPQAAEVFEKVRINPGNFADRPKNSGSQANLTDSAFRAGKEEFKEKLTPLLEVLKKKKRALRIGVNHGSLSERMILRYGDSPLGMVESALEAIQLCEEQGFYQIVVSLKSSNPLVAQQAYRLLDARQQEGKKYPLHLGVTEAGDGEMARVKSLIGIGGLLRDGIGDTIRVSLAEDSVNEIPFAQQILSAVSGQAPKTTKPTTPIRRPLGSYRYGSQQARFGTLALGPPNPVRIGLEEGAFMPFKPDFFYQETKDSLSISGQFIPLYNNLEQIPHGHLSQPFALSSPPPLFAFRRFLAERAAALPPLGLLLPCLKGELSLETDLSLLLSEGYFDLLFLSKNQPSSSIQRLQLFLQATRIQSFQADYIACPSCGRTLFDLQATTAKIKAKTSHLKGIKIGIMGCIVNGPGEMADAHFGYVGSGPGKIDLYFGQERVKRGLEEDQAVEALVALIKEKGAWVEATSNWTSKNS